MTKKMVFFRLILYEGVSLLSEEMKKMIKVILPKTQILLKK